MMLTRGGVRLTLVLLLETSVVTADLCPVGHASPGSPLSCELHPCDQKLPVLCYKPLSFRQHCNMVAQSTTWQDIASSCLNNINAVPVNVSNFGSCQHMNFLGGYYWVSNCGSYRVTSSTTTEATPTLTQTVTMTTDQPVNITESTETQPVNMATTQPVNMTTSQTVNITTSTVTQAVTMAKPTETQRAILTTSQPVSITTSKVTQVVAMTTPIETHSVTMTTSKPIIITTPTESQLVTMTTSKPVTMTTSTLTQSVSMVTPTETQSVAMTTSAETEHDSPGDSSTTETLVMTVGGVTGTLLLLVVVLMACCLARLNRKLRVIKRQVEKTGGGRTSGGQMTLFTDSGNYSVVVPIDELSHAEETVFGDPVPFGTHRRSSDTFGTPRRNPDTFGSHPALRASLSSLASPLHTSLAGRSVSTEQINTVSSDTGNRYRKHNYVKHNYYSSMPRRGDFTCRSENTTETHALEETNTSGRSMRDSGEVEDHGSGQNSTAFNGVENPRAFTGQTDGVRSGVRSQPLPEEHRGRTSVDEANMRGGQDRRNRFGTTRSTSLLSGMTGAGEFLG